MKNFFYLFALCIFSSPIIASDTVVFKKDPLTSVKHYIQQYQSELELLAQEVGPELKKLQEDKQQILQKRSLMLKQQKGKRCAIVMELLIASLEGAESCNMLQEKAKRIDDLSAILQSLLITQEELQSEQKK